MARFSWLHLSDWHQKGSEFDRQFVRDKLLDDLRKREGIDQVLSTINIVIFSRPVAKVAVPAAG
jgi:hypothetical protein